MKNYSLPIIGLAMCLSTALYANEQAQAHQTVPVSVDSTAIEMNTSDEQTKISINQADISSLMQLPGIGLKKAQAIVAYRNSEGPFTHAEQLMQIKGIGKKLFKKLEPHIGL